MRRSRGVEEGQSRVELMRAKGEEGDSEMFLQKLGSQNSKTAAAYTRKTCSKTEQNI